MYAISPCRRSFLCFYYGARAQVKGGFQLAAEGFSSYYERMETLNEWGLQVVRSVQRVFGSGLIIPMQAITFLGSEGFILAVLPLLYWCVDRKKGREDLHCHRFFSLFKSVGKNAVCRAAPV